MLADAAVAVVSIAAGALAAMTGFGIGSLLTPVLAMSVDTRVAVAAVAIRTSWVRPCGFGCCGVTLIGACCLASA